MADRDGTDGNDVLDAVALGDQNVANFYRGLRGNDSLVGGNLADTLDGGQGADTIRGGDGSDSLIDAQGGTDSLSGGTGDDFIRKELGAGTVDGGAGDDEIYVRGYDFVIRGGAGDDFAIVTGDGHTLSGGAGDDYVRTGARAQVDFDGGPGEDSIDFSLMAGAVFVDLANGWGGRYGAPGALRSVENVIGTAGRDLLLGDGLVNVLIGGEGDDLIGGGVAGDILDGGLGTDTLSYAGSNAGVTIDLSKRQVSGGHAEGDWIAGFEKIGGTNLSDVLGGSVVANGLAGYDGDDRLDGRSGADTLSGGGGNDHLTGGRQRDFLSGSFGADRFIYHEIAESSADFANRDVIRDFSRSQDDLIDLAAVDADGQTFGNQAFTFVGASAFSGLSGELRFEVMGSNVMVSADTDGNGRPDFAIFLERFGAMSVNDFVL